MQLLTRGDYHGNLITFLKKISDSHRADRALALRERGGDLLTVRQNRTHVGRLSNPARIYRGLKEINVASQLVGVNFGNAYTVDQCQIRRHPPGPPRSLRAWPTCFIVSSDGRRRFALLVEITRDDPRRQSIHSATQQTTALHIYKRIPQTIHEEEDTLAPLRAPFSKDSSAAIWYSLPEHVNLYMP